MASPKHYNDMTEVESVEGAPHTANTTVNLCVYGVPPSLVYKGVEKGEGRPSMARPRGVLLSPGVGSPPFPSWIRRGRKGERGERKGGPAPHPIRTGLGGGPPIFRLLSLPLKLMKAH